MNLLRRIRSNTDTLSAERIYRAMIMPIFTYCGQITLGWSETRRCQIRNLEQRSHRIILQNSKCLNCELRLSSIENFLKKKACLFVFDCLKGNVCSLLKIIFIFFIHDFNTRNIGATNVVFITVASMAGFCALLSYSTCALVQVGGYCSTPIFHFYTIS